MVAWGEEEDSEGDRPKKKWEQKNGAGGGGGKAERGAPQQQSHELCAPSLPNSKASPVHTVAMETLFCSCMHIAEWVRQDCCSSLLSSSGCVHFSLCSSYMEEKADRVRPLSK